VSRTFAWPIRPLHTHWRIMLSHNLVTEIQKKLTCNKVCKNCFFLGYVVKNPYLAIHCAGDAWAITMSSSGSDFYMVVIQRRYTLGWMFTGWSGVAVTSCDESGDPSGLRDTMWLSTWGLSNPSLIWLLPCRDVACGIWDCLGMISRTCISSSNVVCDGVAAVESIWGCTTAGTFSSVVLYSIFLSRK